jgi:hypothetical protein
MQQIVQPEASLSERIFEEAENRFLDTHLPKLRDLGLVRVSNGHVELVSDPPFPIQNWLSRTAAVELDTADTELPQRKQAIEAPS